MLFYESKLILSLIRNFEHILKFTEIWPDFYIASVDDIVGKMRYSKVETCVLNLCQRQANCTVIILAYLLIFPL